MKRYIVIRDKAGTMVGQCSGPGSDWACPRVSVGEVVPCAGCSLEPDGHGAWLPYAVPEGETTCPVTRALVLASTPDAVIDYDTDRRASGVSNPTTEMTRISW